MTRLLSIHYNPRTEYPVEVRISRRPRAHRLYLTEAEARNLRAMLDGLPDRVLAELPDEREARAIAPWPGRAVF